MRADRLLRLVALLRRHGRLPASRLAELLEVSERTVLRDMEALSAAGVPVYAQRGRHGGCALLGEFRTDVGGLTPHEAQALLAWRGGDLAGDLGLGPALGAALAKVSATVPTPALAEADALAAVVVVDRRRWFAAVEQVPVLPVLREAALARRRVRLSYARPGDATPGTRTVDPYGLVEQAGRWYLLAAHRGRVRSYRVSRVARATVLDDEARVPADLDLAAEWQRVREGFERTWGGQGDGPLLELEVRAEAQAELRLVVGTMLATDAVVEDLGAARWLPDGRRLRLPLRSRRQALAVLLGFGGDVVLVAPEDLQAEVVRRSRAALALHDGGHPTTNPPPTPSPRTRGRS